MSAVVTGQPELGRSLLSAASILDAVEAFRGSIVDLDARTVVGPAALRRGRARFSTSLRARGVSGGDRVVLAVANGPRFFGLLAALIDVGAAPLLLHVKTPPAELKRTALTYGARWIVADEPSLAQLAAAGLRANTLVEEAPWRCQLAIVSSAESGFDDDYPFVGAVPLHLTSGTTATPKVAVRPGRCAVAEAEHYIATVDIDHRDSILVMTPMSHAYAYGMGVMVPLLSHAKVVTCGAFDAARARRALVEQRVTIVPAVPAMLDLLSFGGGSELRDSAPCILSAGSPLPERTARRVFDCCGRHVRPLYGTTETGGITVGDGDGDLVARGYVGPAMQGVSVRMAAGESAGREGAGRVAVASESMMAGYLSHTGIDVAPIRDGWFLTGDLGSVDEAGSLFLQGRESDVINVAGLKVLPCEVESVIASLAGVAEVKVYAGHDRQGRQFVKAAVALDASIDEAAIREHCERELVYYKRPRLLAIVDRLPRSPSGKIVASRLP